MELVILAIVILALVVLGAAALGLVLSILWWALVGLVIGALARLILPGAQDLGLLATALFGIGGSLLGGIVARALDVGSILQFVIAVLVAAGLIALVSASRDRSRSA